MGVLELTLAATSILLALGLVFAMVDSKQNQRKAAELSAFIDRLGELRDLEINERSKKSAEIEKELGAYRDAVQELKVMLNEDREYILKLEDEAAALKKIPNFRVSITPDKKKVAPKKKASPAKKSKKA
jgi:uncharacterized protein HemX